MIAKKALARRKTNMRPIYMVGSRIDRMRCRRNRTMACLQRFGDGNTTSGSNSSGKSLGASGFHAFTTLSTSSLSTNSLLTSIRKKSAGFVFTGRGLPMLLTYPSTFLGEEKYASLPATRNITFENDMKTSVAGWCMVAMIIVPDSPARSVRYAITAFVDAASRPLVGSSNNNTLGPFRRAIARDNRFFCPPEIPFKNLLPTLVFAHSFSPNLVMISSIDLWLVVSWF
mmetsp:Transcript_77007/g.146539  ORF Transcript_77007/g.146539 Transcript_77007/m.146539 type:complete len:228 (-) Transcript_77007:592-1275(-)